MQKTRRTRAGERERVDAFPSLRASFFRLAYFRDASFLGFIAMPANITQNTMVIAPWWNVFDIFFITLQEKFVYR